MHSTLKPKQTDDPHDFIVVAPNVVGVAPADDELSSLLKEAARRSSNSEVRARSDIPADVAADAPIPVIDTTFRPAAGHDSPVPGEQQSIGKAVARAVTALLLAACIGVAAVGWQSSGNVAKQMIATWAPRFVPDSWLPQENPKLSPQPNPPAVEAAANTAPLQSAPPAQTAAEATAPPAVTSSPGEAQLLQSMARDLATVGQQVEQLKANIEQLKARQDQMSRDLAKASVQTARPKLSALPPRPVPAPVRKPIPPYFSPQAAVAPAGLPTAAPAAPQQAEPQPQAILQPQDEPVLRPPMPMR